MPCFVSYATFYISLQVTPPNALLYHAQNVNSLEDLASGLLASTSVALSDFLAHFYFHLCVWNSLCTPFLYLLAFLSKIVYLSLANISGSVGISSFQSSTAFVEVPFFFRALSTVATIASTRRRRKR